MPVQVMGPDGKVHAFADGTSQDDIAAQLAPMYGKGSLGVPPKPAPSGLPVAGDPTAAVGALQPSSQTTPGYRNDEDWTNLAISTLLPRGAVQALQNTPGHAYRMEQAKAAGKNLGNIDDRQRAGGEVLDMLHQLGETADKGSYQMDANGQYVRGPDGNPVMQASAPINDAIGPTNENDSFQTWRARTPIVGKLYEQGYNLHNQLMHDIDGLVTAFVASGSRSGITMSDARQKAFNDTMGRMMRATSKEEFDKIKMDADRIIRGTFGLPHPKIEGRQQTMQGQAPGRQTAAPETKVLNGVTYTKINGTWHGP